MALLTESHHINLQLQGNVHLAIEMSNFDKGLPLRDQNMAELVKVIDYVR